MTIRNLELTIFALIAGLITVGCRGTYDDTWQDPRVNDSFTGDSWFASLPEAARSAIIWSADHEEGTLSDWEDRGTETYTAGGGVFNTGPADQVYAEVCAQPVHSGSYAVATTINGAVRAENGLRAVRLMRWTDAPWDEGGDYFPDDAFYSVWIYLPSRYSPAKQPPWDPGDGGWWNVFQFKSDNEAGSQPIAVLNLWWSDARRQMEFYLDTKSYPDPTSASHENTTWEQPDPITVPVGQWFHIEARYRQRTDATGSVTIYQNGENILHADGIVTKLSEQIAWGIGNYTDHVQAVDSVEAPVGETGRATIFFDDAAVSTISLWSESRTPALQTMRR